VSEKTIARLLEAAGPDVPVMAHYVLRTFSFEKIAEIAAGCGLKTLKGIKPIRQRRFASSEEYESALARLKTMGVDPSGFESEGWYYADLYLSLPEARLAQSLPAQLQNLFECG
jgi:dTDP-4-amino-4,6-dideoxygalactose transaminase